MKQKELPDPTTARWIRLPVRGHCPFAGFSRAKYYDLIHRGLIKSANVKDPGKLTGVRLVWLPSVLALIERHVETPATVDSAKEVA